MSVCDEGWGKYPEPVQDKRFCPCALTYGGDGDRVCGCELLIWHEWEEGWGEGPPEKCSDALGLKARIKNSDFILEAKAKGCQNCKYCEGWEYTDVVDFISECSVDGREHQSNNGACDIDRWEIC